MKRIIALLLALLLAFGLTACSLESAQDVIDIIDAVTDLTPSPEATDISASPSPEATESAASTVTETPLPQEDAPSPIDEDGWYYSAQDVSLYLHTYGHLPSNFITKAEARRLGWEGGSVEKYAEGYAIGGDVFGNFEGLLPEADGRTYYECDIDTHGYHSRGARRIVFSNDGLIYYTGDHYESFELLYGEE